MPAQILIVEDNPANLELMCYLLLAFKYPYIVARDGVEALEVARAEKPDLIICDIQLPKMDGYQVVRTLKSEPAFQAIPMIAVTALAMMGDRERVLASGFNGYIAKPIQPETFVSRLEAFLDPSQKSGVGFSQPAAAAEEAPAPREQRRGVILVADDHSENLDLASSILEPSGYRVVTAGSVREASETALRIGPDMILSDVHLGDGTGFDLLDHVRGQAALNRTEFILISSSAPSRDERLRASAQDIRLILRPIDSARLLAIVESRWPRQPPEIPRS